MRLRTAILPIALAVVLLGLASCGGGDDTNGSTPGLSETPGAEGTADGGGGAGGSDVTLTVADATGTVGQEVNVVLTALGVGDPGIGAWTVDVTFDPDIATAVSCDGNEGPDVTAEPKPETPTPTGPGLAFCNPKFEDNIARSTGAVVDGASGDVPLATITFMCDAAGASDLTITVDTFADAKVGEPTDINHHEENGTLTCS